MEIGTLKIKIHGKTVAHSTMACVFGAMQTDDMRIGVSFLKNRQDFK